MFRRSGCRYPLCQLPLALLDRCAPRGARPRVATDQTVENVTGVGAPPHTWPMREQVVDVLHKAVYSFATGVVADRLIAAQLESRRGTTSH